MRKLRTFILVVASITQALLPCQPVLATTSLQSRLKDGVELMNAQKNFGQMISSLEKIYPRKKYSIDSFADLLRRRNVDFQQRLPVVFLKGSQLTITGNSSPITFTKLEPLALKIGKVSWEAKQGDSIEQVYDSLLAFLEKSNAGRENALLNFLIPRAEAHPIIWIGLVILALNACAPEPENSDRNRLNKLENSMFQDWKHTKKLEANLLEEIRKRNSAEIYEKYGPFLEKAICLAPKFSEYAKKLMAKNGAPTLVTLDSEDDWEDPTQWNTKTIYAVWNFGDDHYETVQYKQKTSINISEPQQLSASTRPGRPWVGFRGNKTYTTALYEPITKDGADIRKMNEAARDDCYGKPQCIPWTMTDAKEVTFPSSSITTSQASVMRRNPTLMKEVCANTKMKKKILEGHNIYSKDESDFILTAPAPRTAPPTGGAPAE